jgi:hypothetical protein
MRLLPCLLVAATLCALPARADPTSAERPLTLLPDDSGSGDNGPYHWNDAWTPDGRRFGLGIQLGFPSALTFEGVVSSNTSLVVGLGAFGYRFFTPALSFYVDYLWHPGILAHPNRDWLLSWYVGVGGWATVYEDGYRYSGYEYGGDTNLALALRVPLGLDLSLGRIPLMFYVEVVPALLVFPNIDIGVGASIGVRLFF